MMEVTVEYAVHFYEYVEGHTGKHLSGHRIRILLLNLPSLPQPHRPRGDSMSHRYHAMMSYYIIIVQLWYHSCICPVANVLGWAPLIPCFIVGNTHPTIPTSSRTAESWDRHPPLPSRIAGTAADCTRWISGCGAMDEASPGRCPSTRQRLPGRIKSAR